jgi:glycosyltransferase involved in cell wall biosynthesis
MNSRTINILYVTDSPTVSGAEHVLLSYLTRFREPEFRTHVFLRRSNKRLVEELRGRNISHTTTTNFSERVIRTTLSPYDLFCFGKSFRRVKKELIDLGARNQTDILHSISYPTALYTALAARAAALPHIWHEHGVKRIHPLNRHLYRFTAATCKWVIGPSDAVTGALASAGIASAKIRTVYNGIDLGRFRPNAGRSARVREGLGLAPGQPAIALIGQLLPHKGHQTLIESAPKILRRFPSARFFIVGSLENPPYEAELRKSIAEAGCESSFVFTGWRSDMQDLIGAIDISVVPTLTPEPAALSLMETMALSRPLVATRSGGTPELVPDGEAGLLFSPGRADELADCVLELLTNPDRAARLSSAGRRRMEDRFSEERHLREIADLYRSCLVPPSQCFTA